MGFYHTEHRYDDFHTPDCSGANFPEQTLLHARIAYSRPVGSMDIDDDHVTTPLAAWGTAPAARYVSCTLAEIGRSK